MTETEHQLVDDTPVRVTALAKLIPMSETGLSRLLKEYPPTHPALLNQGTGTRRFYRVSVGNVDEVVRYLRQHQVVCRAAGNARRREKALARGVQARQHQAPPPPPPATAETRLNILWERVTYLCRELETLTPEDLL